MRSGRRIVLSEGALGRQCPGQRLDFCRASGGKSKSATQGASSMSYFRRSVAALAMAASVGGLLGAAPVQAQTLKAVMHSDVKIRRPIRTTGHIQRKFRYL